MNSTIHGFTLIELMIVIAILCSIIISVPPLLKMIEKNGVVRAVELLRSDLQLARLMAINKKNDSIVNFCVNGNQYYRRNTDNQTVYLSKYRGGVSFLKTGPDGKEMAKKIAFNKQGMSMSVVPANIYMSNRDLTRIFRIRVMLAGGIAVFEWNNNTWQ